MPLRLWKEVQEMLPELIGSPSQGDVPRTLTENPTEFYKIAARLIPTEVAAPDGGGITVIVNRLPERDALPPDRPALPAPAVEH
jgi:hypothetical protein